RVELAGSGVAVVTICPGYIATPMTHSNPYPMPFLVAPDKAARLIARAIERRKRSYVFPWPMAIVGGALRFMPRFLYDAAFADDDLPDRVARIASLAGQLYLSAEDRATEWMAVSLNYPVTSGDNLWQSGDGQAEVDYGGDQFRIGAETSMHVSRLDDRQLALF